MLTDYNLSARVRGGMTDDTVDRWFDALEGHSLAVGGVDDQHSQLTITVRASSLIEAAELGARAMADAAGELETLEVMTTAEFDRIHGIDAG